MNKHYLLNTSNYYETFFIDEKTRPIIVIAPGGAYRYTSEREAEPIAKVFNKGGYHALILHYRETLDTYPFTGKLVYETLKEIKLDKRVSKIVLLGFSAGGHLMCEYSLHYKDYGNIKPDLLMLSYPVITSDERYSHKFSFETLLGDKYNDLKIRKYVSLENAVTADAPDLFLWGTYTDEAVNVMNSFLLVNAYYKNHLNCEYHMYSKGGHGLALGNKKTSNGEAKNIEPLVTTWTKLALNWLDSKLGGSNEK